MTRSHCKLLLVLILFLIPQTAISQENQSSVADPMIFGEGIISTGDHDSHPAFSPDGKTLYFVKMAPDFSKWTIYVSENQGGKWSEPQIASFSGQYWDADPFFTKDGKTLYFISNRPVKEGDSAKNDFDIWKVEKEGNVWGRPVRLPAPINSDTSEYYPTIAETGTMYFGSRRKGGKGGADIYASKIVNGKYESAENLGDAVNTAGNEFEPFISPDESFLIFMASPTESLEQADLFISYKEKSGWTKAMKLPEPFNSYAAEFSPKISFDGKTFYFSSARNLLNQPLPKPETTAEMNRRIRQAGNGLLDIYETDFAALQKAIK